MSIVEDKRPLSEEEGDVSNKRQKYDQPQESDLRSTSSNHVSLPLSQVIDNPTTKPLDGPEKLENFHQSNQLPTPAPSEPPQPPLESDQLNQSTQPTPIPQDPPTPQPAAMATPTDIPADTPQHFQPSQVPQTVKADSPALPAPVTQSETSAAPVEPSTEAPSAESLDVKPAIAAEGQPQPLNQPLAPPQPEVQQSSEPQPNLTHSSLPPSTDAVAQPPLEQTHQPVAASSTEPQPQAMEVTAQSQAQPADAQGEEVAPYQQAGKSNPQEHHAVKAEPEQTDKGVNGESVKVETPQQPYEAYQVEHQPQPFDAPGVVAHDAHDYPDGEDTSSAPPIVPPTPAGTEPIILPNGSKLPPRSAAIGIPGGPSFSFNQLKYVSTLMKQLKKMKAAVPFLTPVDYMSLGVPHYPEVISEPSDLGSVDRRVQKTIKAEEGGYHNFNDWEADVRRIFRNTEWFNGVEHPVSKMGKQVEESFDKQLKKMPPSTNDAVPSTSRGRGAPRRSQETGRPRRDTQQPVTAQQANDANRGRRRKTTAYGRNGTADQMRHCAFILKELHKKVHSSYAAPFYDPVDYLALGLPDYPQVIQQPMDLSTIGQKFNYGDYEGPNDFFSDMKLMLGNCYKYNPPGTPVHEAGKQTEKVFDDKWTQLPPLSTPLEISDDENSDTVKALQRQIEDMQKSLNDFKKGGGVTGRAAAGSTTANGGGGRGGKRGSTGGQVGRPRRKSYDEDDENYQVPEITFDMKKELAGKIQQLEGDQLDKAIKIIYETLDLDNNSDEIELDIDVLPTKTLQKLYMFVVKPQKQKRGPYNKQHVDVDLQPRPPKRAGTGGVKRKSMNEDEEALKIQALEAKLKSFEGGSTEGADISGVGAMVENDEASSGSDSDSVSDSGSESD
ncbi:hypothetical protein E3P98_04008 [Wallemia ichthyophaga]|nr:hypothetical protein E3P98_04008 [Wallemia ichthyophaga]